jgi:hypothetical protein
MRSASWHDIAELVGMAAIVASLVFVGLQMQQAQKIARSEMNATTLANAMEESNAIIAHADIWVRGTAGEELTSVEEVIFSRLVRNANDLAYFSVQQQRLLGLDQNSELDIATYAGFLYENPGARRAWRTREAELQRYRGVANRDERVTSAWIEAIESYLVAFERQAELRTP